MPFYNWSQVAADNATADSAVNWQEGQAPSSINDSARAMMASIAKWRDDITGILVAGGTSTAYAISSNQGIVANTDGFTVQFTPAASSTGAVTLSVDSQAPKPLRFRTGVDLPPGAIISGSLYQATYRGASQEWLLHSFDSSIYAIPIGASIDYWGSTTPNSAFAAPTGQAISRTTYATLFGLIGTTYGSGDGSTTFNLPNAAGRVLAQREGSASLLTSSFFGGNSTVLGAIGGSQFHYLTTTEMPSHSHANTLSDSGHAHNLSNSRIYGNFQTYTSGTPVLGIQLNNGDDNNVNTASAASGISISNASAGNDGAHNNVQPTMIVNRIMRIV